MTSGAWTISTGPGRRRIAGCGQFLLDAAAVTDKYDGEPPAGFARGFDGAADHVPRRKVAPHRIDGDPDMRGVLVNENVTTKGCWI